MSGTYPASPGFSSADHISVQPSVSFIAQSGKRTSNLFGGHLWRIRGSYSMLKEADHRAIYAFLISQKGVKEDFELVFPRISTPLGIATGTPLVDGASQTGNALITDGWTASQTGIMKAGDVFRLGDKVYMMTADANSDGAGAATLAIEPALIASPANNAALTVTDVPFKMAIVENSFQSTVRPGGIYSLSLDFVESL